MARLARVEVFAADEIAIVNMMNRTVRRCFLLGNDPEVAWRWLMLCPERRDKHGKPEEPSEFELNHVRKDKAKLKVIRSRLSDISWWMWFPLSRQQET